jgi:hypothetical protein
MPKPIFTLAKIVRKNFSNIADILPALLALATPLMQK